MAGSYNKVLLMGNLTRDVELRYAQGSNNAIAKFGLAVNRRYRTADGEQREEVTFVDCDAFGKTAEIINQYLRKGRPIFIEGHLRLDTWEKEGQKFSKLKVVVDNFQFVDSKDSGDGGGGGAGAGRSAPSAPRSGGGESRGASRSTQGNYEPVSEDDIPF
ncbi:MAG: single-stranded DNA-binding protein [Planctomycetota bacterium]|nr:single-stranded DNA-binding protein [Planctomycetota bacterium]